MADNITLIPATGWGDLPEWGDPILHLLSERIFLTHRQIQRLYPIWGQGNMKRKLNKLADMNYLRRYELITNNQKLTGYTLGIEGSRIVQRLIPDLNYYQAAQFIVANNFCMAHGVVSPRFWVSKALLSGEIKIGDDYLSLWCPRKTETRLNSLKAEVSMRCRGLIVVAPSLKLIGELSKNIEIYVPVYYVTDNQLSRFLIYKDKTLVILG